MNVARYFLAVLVAFVFFNLYEYFLHAVFLKEQYEAIPQLLRAEETGTFFLWLSLAYASLSLAFCYIFTRGYQGRGVGEGVRYGVLIWLVAALPTNLISYAVQPWPSGIMVTTAVAYLVELVIIGALVALIYKPKTAAA